MAGYYRQSMNRQMGEPGLHTRRASESHSAIQRVQLRWSFWSPSKSGKGLSDLRLLYFWLVVRFFSAGFEPPEA